MKIKRFNEQKEERQRLPMNIITSYYVNVQDIDDLFTNIYSPVLKFYSCDSFNYSDETQHFILDITGDLGEDEDEVMNVFLDLKEENDKNYYDTESITCEDILNKLCQDGHIPSGRYVISICG